MRRPGIRLPRIGVGAWIAIALALAGLSVQVTSAALPPIFPPDKPPPPGSLKQVPPPLPPNLGEFVVDRQAATVLGKALFWDEAAGSDGLSCASCHFHAGADNRSKNQLSPGLNNKQGPPLSNTFNVTASNYHHTTGAPPGGGPNYTLKAADFPFHQLADPNDRDSTVTFDTDDVAASQGVFKRDFVSLLPDHEKADLCKTAPSFFDVGGVNVRQVEPRNAPTIINAIYNFRNLWDGKANNVFNGRNPFGMRDPTAGIDPLNSVLAADAQGNLTPYPVSMPDASLASVAVGPLINDVLMSCTGRVFEQVGQKLLKRRPLQGQKVEPTDSALGPYANVRGDGFAGATGLTITYPALIRKAFPSKFWSSGKLTTEGYTQMEKNFPLFWGLSIMMYQSTLVSDNSPFDQYMDGNISALTTQQLDGFLQVFMNKGGCVFCHSGAEFTSAATHLQDARLSGSQVEHMIMGDGTVALYDSGFYNIGVRPTGEDIGLGGKDKFGNPLSWARQAKNAAILSGPVTNLFGAGPDKINVYTCNFQIAPCVPVNANFRDAVDGSFKVPSLRNVELTGPYFHNGGQATLEQVVDFYNRGGDGRGPEAANTTGFGANPTNRAPVIGQLGLTATDKANLVAFLKSLTDDRVRWEKAPFDHPELHIPDGHPGNQNRVEQGRNGLAKDDFDVIPAVGAAGRGAKKLPPLQSFADGLR